MNVTKEQLLKIIEKGYSASLSTCFTTAEIYARGFVDGMKYERTGDEPKDKLQEIIDKYSDDEEQYDR